MLATKRKDIYRFGLSGARQYDGNMEYFFVIKINAIYALKRTHSFRDFLKLADGKPVERVMNYCIIRDRDYAHHDKHTTRGEIMSNHMADLLLRGGIKEKRYRRSVFL